MHVPRPIGNFVITPILVMNRSTAIVWGALAFFLVIAPKIVYAQRDVLQKNADTISVFQGTQIAPMDDEYDTSGTVKIGVYLSTYYASYSDPADSTGFVKFPTVAPRNNSFGLNILQASVRYHSSKFRSILTLHTGDIATSAWSPTYNFIQEANIGVKLHRHMWIDAGFFRTYIGLESIQPRENITMSLAIPTYFEPYYLAGIKFTYSPKPHLLLQANAFDGFNTFIESNKNKTLGLSAFYDIRNRVSITYNLIYCDESPAKDSIRHHRLYNNLYAIVKMKKQVLAFEWNVGVQQHTNAGTNKAAWMYSGILVYKQWIYQKKIAAYARAEYYHDMQSMLCPKYYNADGSTDGLRSAGATIGVEFKFIPNSYIRVETRRLETLNDIQLFKRDDHFVKFRNECIVGMGVWF